ncbi:ABC transporter permease/substrate-binding protein [Rhodocytophaga aerolata]|uniref:ABC transporter permease/substrate-binding protein n=1 Tax=Rhodocytophaga aerolata TaxID=455078 RepID=A0ABT8R8T1_9BACT|nr:ABC transporter permease/substrate-binding protein [Rhodocytophaga aerolata]MDO1448505.1 ABC transporter permease/substrate-binding protein [Rhodocytophaga aerolata]
MDYLSGLLAYFMENGSLLAKQTAEHLGLTIVSVAMAILTGVPLGIVCTHYRKLATIVLGVTGMLQTIPSIALLGFMIPVVGIGALPAIIALFLYALLPIVRNTVTGIHGVDPSVREAAIGMGLSRKQLLTKVELPLALPVIFAGVRTATVINVGVATLAALIASGGLGESIFGGIALNNTYMILAGAIPAALLAIVLDNFLGWLQGKNVARIQPGAWLGIWLSITGITLWMLFSSVSHSFRAGFAPEFMVMSEGYPGLRKTYNFQLSTVVLQSGLMYDALHAKAVDVISGYSTDGRIKEYKLFTLKDDLSHFPSYDAGITIRQEVLDTYPQIRTALEQLSSKFTDADMIQLNYQVDVLKKSPASVATNYLKRIGLFRPPTQKPIAVIRIGSKIFTEQYILAEMIARLIEGYTNLKADVKTGMGGTQICFEALASGAIDLYPEYSGTGLEVILKQKHLLPDSVSKNPEYLYAYVDREYKKKFNIRWLPPLGFNNTYALLMRQEQAKALHIESISDLKRYIESK